MPEAALAAAASGRRRGDEGTADSGSCTALPISAKDLIAVGGVTYASGRKPWPTNIAPVDAPSVERAKAAGAILIGKTTTSEFGCKPVGDNPLTGITRIPGT